MKQVMYDFLTMKAKAYSNISLVRPLTEQEYQAFKKTMEELTH